MKFIILLSCLIIQQSRADSITDDDVYIDGIRYQTEVVIDNVNLSWPWPLAVDYTSNNLYFLENNGLAILSLLNTSKHKYIEEISNARSLTVDQETQDLYLGTFEGIYKYEPKTNVAELVGAKDEYIWQVYFKGVLYYTNFVLNNVFTLIKEHSDKLDTMEYEVFQLVVDNEDVIFFTNSTGLYSQHLKSNVAALHYDNAIVYNLALDRNGKVYFSSNNGIHEITNTTIRKIVSVSEPKGITFDMNNNIIYCDENKIYRLKPIVEIKTVNIENELERKVNIIDAKIDKLFTDLVKILESSDKNYNDLLQKNVELLNVKVERQLESMDKKIYELSQKVDVLVRDQVERKKESMDVTTVIPLTSQVYQQTDYYFPQVIHVGN